ncbi:Uncharacterised protein [Escherichia coli]|uniref:Uncharacterized protein n=3 Tax=Enterobacteriaceae TaxID=543 RepID=A0A376M8Y8_ECOLX|nr:Uncharacterised protein [Escherichia coli]
MFIDAAAGIDSRFTLQGDTARIFLVSARHASMVWRDLFCHRYGDGVSFRGTHIDAFFRRASSAAHTNARGLITVDLFCCTEAIARQVPEAGSEVLSSVIASGREVLTRGLIAGDDVLTRE